MFTTHNVLAIARRASAAEIETGMTWYEDAHAIAREIAPHNVETGAGVLAALSPRENWTRNVMLARMAMENGFATGTLGRNIAKANAIIAGAEPLDVLGGNKVRSFYANIHNPDGGGVTIDRHAFDVAMGRVTDDKVRRMLDRKGMYDHLSEIYLMAGAEYGMHGKQMQAITWCTWRRLKGIK